jgi:propionate CoA-transferase
MNSKIVSARDAVAGIKTGQTVACLGCLGWITPDSLLTALAERFTETAQPRDLSFVFPIGTGDTRAIRGMDRVAIEGLMKRVIGGTFVNAVDPATGKRPEINRLIREDRIAAYAWPMGAIMHWLREVGRGGTGYLTTVGLGTYADPRVDGARLTPSAPNDLTKVIQIENREHLFYPTWPVDVGFIRATSADEDGNLSFEEEPLISAAIAIAVAVKASGGKVIAQVKRIVPRRQRRTQDVRVPGALVDYVVVSKEQIMGTNLVHEESFLGGVPFATDTLPTLAEGLDKVICRRVAQEVRTGTPTIFGFGISTSVPLVMSEMGYFRDGRIDDYIFTTEHGPFGGMVMNGAHFSPNRYADGLLDGPTQFDLIDGGGVKVALLSFGQFDSAGNINVSRLGDHIVGAGGFIDIAERTPEIVFSGSFTAGGLDIGYGSSGVRILREGRTKKFVEKVDHLTFSAKRAVNERGQSIRFVTERAGFTLAPEGLILTEIAPGIDVRRDILDQMAFAPARIADSLKIMDEAVFRPLHSAAA